MPNFRGVRFTNAHETLIWAQKERGRPYTFNHQAMRAFNDDLQMRSDWYLPLCTGRERIKANGRKAHSTQKPEALLYRVLLASTHPGDVVLDPFFGTGTTGAAAQRLRRHWIGIERDPAYASLAQERIAALPEPAAGEELFRTPNPRREPRLPFGALLEHGLLRPGDRLFLRGAEGGPEARVLADGRIEYNGETGTIHQVARRVDPALANGWHAWFVLDLDSGERVPLDDLRQELRNQLTAEASTGRRHLHLPASAGERRDAERG
jgi:modification methylase